MHSQELDALDNAIRWVRLLWDTPIRTGTRRYYDNFLYAFAFLALAGEYRCGDGARLSLRTRHDGRTPSGGFRSENE